MEGLKEVNRPQTEVERDRQGVHAIKPSEGGRWSLLGKTGRCAEYIMTMMREGAAWAILKYHVIVKSRILNIRWCIISNVTDLFQVD